MRGIRARTHARPQRTRTRYARARCSPCGSMIPLTRRRHSLATLARAPPCGSIVFVLRATERSHAPADNRWHCALSIVTRCARSFPLRAGYVTGSCSALMPTVFALRATPPLRPPSALIGSLPPKGRRHHICWLPPCATLLQDSSRSLRSRSEPPCTLCYALPLIRPGRGQMPAPPAQSLFACVPWQCLRVPMRSRSARFVAALRSRSV